MSERPEDEDPLGFGDASGAPEEGPQDTPPDGEADKYAHRRDPDLAAYGIGPGSQPAPARLPAGSSRYTWFVGVVAVLVIAYVSVNSITTTGPGSRGVQVNEVAPPFAAPLALSDLEGDVNVARRDDPSQGDQAGKVRACSIRRPDVLTICELYADKPVVLAFFATKGRQCTSELDKLERLAATRKDVAFAAIAIRGDRGDVRDLVRERGWSFPVGYDGDGVLSTLYNVVICPELTFIRKGGRVAGTSFGEKDEPVLATLIDALAAGRALPAG